MNNLYFNQKNRRQLNGPSAAVIKYDDNTGKSPTVVAQGNGAVAQQIIELAKKNNVHLQEDSSLLQNLLDIDLGDSVPPQLYGVIAEIFILLEELEKNY
ncbi:EscU/YscU/HrcU family type III secretion system export apparatus switch protein [Mesobacillus subterraneus]|uniref:EscU/YscU/HrcU family type III secretion system export apparatus switch protein n=1 Tax=Mesobacillus subterraneus TaxID=285983 RepID=UPI00203AAFCC|nr:EscU/YscU/HrcU family type III secretion system export apparatus switch protein [Mesobacillus subterraneus]MCM3574107.1 EscU/YscU/HrcU family type III secretion system export apparatus switch protein [Mesobacillus subterraneus]